MLELLIGKWATYSQQLQKQWRWLGYLLVLGAFLYIFLQLFLNRMQLLSLPWREFGWASLISFGIYLISLLLQYFAWTRIISRYHRTGWRDFLIYFQSIALRRLPGGIWHWVGRTSLYSGTTQVPGRAVILANFLEWIMLLCLAGMISSLGFASIHWVWRIVSAIILLGLAIYLAICSQTHTSHWWVKLKEALLWICLYLLAWWAGGVIIYLYGNASAAKELTVLYSIWVWAVSGGITWLIVFLPSGLGLREITLSVLLGPFLPLSTTLVISLLIRFVFMFADIVWGLLGWWLGKWMLIQTREK